MESDKFKNEAVAITSQGFDTVMEEVIRKMIYEGPQPFLTSACEKISPCLAILSGTVTIV